MIKLIASDMDGSLLDDNGKLPKDFFKTIEKLNDKKIKFVVASGRPYYTLYENFKPISDSLHYICDNGAFVVENGKVVDISIIDKNSVNEIVQTCSKIKNIQLVLCGTKGAYHLDLPNEFKNEISKYYVKDFVVNDFSDIDDDIFKIAICDLGIPRENSYKVLAPKFQDDLTVVVSGEFWVDFTNKGVNKGTALESIQEAENISSAETMAFGDYYNDISMLQKAHYSFVMENANDDMKQYGNYIAKSNTEHGVIKAIEEYVF